MKKKSKRSVTAPVSYDPGKGRPKEHLAYLNYQEMQALMRINGGNKERGPKGLPSFPPDDAIGSSSRTTTRSSGPSGGMMGGTGSGGSVRTSSSTSYGSGSTSYGGGGRDSTSYSSPNRSTGSSYRDTAGTGRGAPSTSRSTSMGSSNQNTSSGAPRDAAVRAMAAAKDAAQARQNQAFKADMGRSVAPDTRTSSIPGGALRGALNAVQRSAEEAARGIASIPVVTVSNYAVPGGSNAAYRAAGFTPSFSPTNEVAALRDIMQSQIGFGDSPFTEDMRQTVSMIGGEVGLNRLGEQGPGQVTQVMINRSLINNNLDRDFARAGLSARTGINDRFKNDLSDPEQWEGSITSGYKTAMGSEAVRGEIARAAINDIMSGNIPAPDATGFRSSATTSKEGTNVGGNIFGNYDRITGDQVAAVRGASAGAAQYDNAARVADAAARPAPMTLMGGAALSQKKTDNDTDRLITFNNADGTRTTTSTSEIKDMLVRNGATEDQAESLVRAYEQAGINTYKTDQNFIKTPSGVYTRAEMENRVAAETPFPRTVRSAAGTYTSPYDVKRSAAGTYTKPYDVRRPAAGTYTSPYDVSIRTPPPRPSYSSIPQPDSLGILRNPVSGMSFTPGLPADASYFGDISNRRVTTPSMSYYGDIPDRRVTTPSMSYYGDIPDARASAPPARALRSAAGTYTSPYDVRRSAAGTYTSPYDVERIIEIENVPEEVTTTSSIKDAGASGIGGILSSPSIGSYSNALMDAKKTGSVTDTESDDIERGAETVARAEGNKGAWAGDLKPITDRIPGAEVRTVTDENGKTYTVSMSGETAIANLPSLRNTVAARAGSEAYDYISNSYNSVNPDESSVTDSEMADPAFAGNLIGEDAMKAAKESGYFRPDVFRNEDFLSDPTQLGMLREPVTGPLNATDMAKLVQRSFAENIAPEKYGDEDVGKYLTSGERTRNIVSGIVEALVSRGMGMGAATRAAKKMLGVEKTKDFLARPSYEQEALYDYAREMRGEPRRGPVVPGGTPGGIGDIVGSVGFPAGGDVAGTGRGGDYGSEGGGYRPPPTTPTEQPEGPRPAIYYEWDLGINIPSPGDPLYTMYMTYLAERNTASEELYG